MYAEYLSKRAITEWWRTDGSPIEFDISGTGEDYIDFANTMLYVKAKVTQNNGDDLAADEFENVIEIDRDRNVVFDFGV